jgi:hypothetical protein
MHRSTVIRSQTAAPMMKMFAVCVLGLGYCLITETSMVMVWATRLMPPQLALRPLAM